MYKSVEYKFKKNSIYNKRIIRLFIIYVVVFVCLFIVMTDLKLPLLAIMFSPLIYSPKYFFACYFFKTTYNLSCKYY